MEYIDHGMDVEFVVTVFRPSSSDRASKNYYNQMPWSEVSIVYAKESSEYLTLKKMLKSDHDMDFKQNEI